jgi:hypothetical protein
MSLDPVPFAVKGKMMPHPNWRPLIDGFVLSGTLGVGNIALQMPIFGHHTDTRYAF